MVVIRPYTSWPQASGVGRDLRDTGLAMTTVAIVLLGLALGGLSRDLWWVEIAAAACGIWCIEVSSRFWRWQLRLHGGDLEISRLLHSRVSLELKDIEYLGVLPRRGSDLYRAGVVFGRTDSRQVVRLRDGGDVEQWLAQSAALRALPRQSVSPRVGSTVGRALRLTLVTLVGLVGIVGGLIAWGALANR